MAAWQSSIVALFRFQQLPRRILYFSQAYGYCNGRFPAAVQETSSLQLFLQHPSALEVALSVLVRRLLVEQVACCAKGGGDIQTMSYAAGAAHTYFSRAIERLP